MIRPLLCEEAFSVSDSAVHLGEQRLRLERALVFRDVPLVLDMSKSLIESVLKTILADRVGEANLNQDMSPLYRSVQDDLPLNGNADVNEKLSRLTRSIIHNVSELRNRYGAASHGDDGYFENPVTPTDADLVANISDVFCAYIYKRHKESIEPDLAERIYYQDHSDFNDWLDGQNDSFGLPSGGEVLYSEAIFKLDQRLYREMLLQYSDTEEQDEQE